MAKDAFGTILRNFRVDSGYTRDGLAKLIGVSGPAVTRWEQGVTHPSARAFALIARTMGISVEALHSLAEDDVTTPPTAPTQGELMDMVYLTKALAELGVINPDGSVNKEKLTMMKNTARTLKYFLKVSSDDDETVEELERVVKEPPE